MGARVAVNPTPRRAEQLANGLPFVIIYDEPQPSQRHRDQRRNSSRHQQPKGPAPAGPHLDHRATSRLYRFPMFSAELLG
jgi:hypothetical protein